MREEDQDISAQPDLHPVIVIFNLLPTRRIREKEGARDRWLQAAFSKKKGKYSLNVSIFKKNLVMYVFVER